MEQQVRIDKFLWSIRVYKTRTEAADACRSGKVSVNGAEAKASIGNRVGAKLVSEFAEDITPQEELDKLNAPFETVYVRRDRGTGRPTKKERRDLDRLMDDLF